MFHPRSSWSQNVFIHFRYLDRVAQLIMVIELSGVQFGLESYAWFEITSMVSDQIARQEVNYHFYYIHFEIAQITDLLSSDILLMQCWAGLKLHSSLFFWGWNKSFKICHMILFVFHFPAIWLVTLNKLWNLIGCFFFWCSLLIGWEKDAI